jgi:predicted small secreted protein
MNNKLIAALASLTLLACGNPVAPAGEDLSAASEAELKISAATTRKKTLTPAPVWQARVSATSTAPVFASTFSIETTYDLFIAFDIPVALSGQHVAIFEVSAPNGQVYQRTEVPFSSGTATSYRVWSAMPVAGTWIQQYAMSGGWTVRVFLDSEQVSRAVAAFVLQ